MAGTFDEAGHPVHDSDVAEVEFDEGVFGCPPVACCLVRSHKECVELSIETNRLLCLEPPQHPKFSIVNEEFVGR